MVFRNVTLCNFVDKYERFGGACSLLLHDRAVIAVYTEATDTSEASVHIYQTARRQIPGFYNRNTAVITSDRLFININHTLALFYLLCPSFFTMGSFIFVENL
jgi:hypothetical protein